MERTTMKTVDEIANDISNMYISGRGWSTIAHYVLDLIAQAKPEPSPGDSMTDEDTDEEVARELHDTYNGGGGFFSVARRARELFRPGSKAPEGRPQAGAALHEIPSYIQQLRIERDNTIADARRLARHARDLMAAARVRENLPEIEELVEEWADVDDPEDLDAEGSGG